jgi:hypothetical protein
MQNWGREDIFKLTIENKSLCQDSNVNGGRVVNKSRRLRWAGHVARMGRKGVHTGFW